jgi:hypothetical protein
MLYGVIMILKCLFCHQLFAYLLLSLIETNINTFGSKPQRGLIHKIQFILLPLSLVLTFQLSIVLTHVSNKTVTSEI